MPLPRFAGTAITGTRSTVTRALVVDASADGGPMLPVGLAGGANLVLAAPPTMRSTLVTDSTPPVVALP